MTGNGNKMAQFGFSTKRGGAHTSRTLMLDELRAVFDHVEEVDARPADYRKAIEGDNCLGKRSVRTRHLTYNHLVDLYALDPAVTIFRTMRYFWQRDPEGQPLLALLCGFARDSILRSAAPFILRAEPEENVRREDLQELIESFEPGRFSQATLKSTAQNINSSFTKSGHLKGRVRKIRTQAVPTAGSASYALLLGYLSGFRGKNLFATPYTELLDCKPERVLELAETASQRGWIVMKRIGNVVEVLFPNLLNEQEMEWIREQD